MAIATTPTETYTCETRGCSVEFGEHQAVDGSYCSRQCSLRDDGRALLDHLKRDHRYCHACFRRTKEIARPSTDAPEHVIGLQYLTEHGQLGPLEVWRGDRPRDDDESPYRGPWLDEDPEATAPADRLVQTATICQCGTTDHRDAYQRETWLVHPREATRRLCRALERLGQEGQHDKYVDVPTLAATVAEAIRESGRWTADEIEDVRRFLASDPDEASHG